MDAGGKSQHGLVFAHDRGFRVLFALSEQFSSATVKESLTVAVLAGVRAELFLLTVVILVCSSNSFFRRSVTFFEALADVAAFQLLVVALIGAAQVGGHASFIIFCFIKRRPIRVHWTC